MLQGFDYNAGNPHSAEVNGQASMSQNNPSHSGAQLRDAADSLWVCGDGQQMNTITFSSCACIF